MKRFLEILIYHFSSHLKWDKLIDYIVTKSYHQVSLLLDRKIVSSKILLSTECLILKTLKNGTVHNLKVLNHTGSDYERAKYMSFE